MKRAGCGAGGALTKAESDRLVADLCRLGYCLADIASMARLGEAKVRRALRDAGLRPGPKPGRRVHATHHWFAKVHLWFWGSVFIQAYAAAIERRGPYTPPGVAIRDASIVSDWRFGSEMWAPKDLTRRARMVARLAADYEEGRVVLRRCPTCHFRYIAYTVALENVRRNVEAGCPCCQALKQAALPRSRTTSELDASAVMSASLVAN